MSTRTWAFPERDFRSAAEERLRTDYHEFPGEEAALRLKLHWRACYTKHFFHVLPGETLLEVGAGDGVWTKQLARVFGGENRITSLASSDFEREAPRMEGVQFIDMGELSRDARRAGSFDYIVGSFVDSTSVGDLLTLLYRVLKPGGKILFFQPNASHVLRRFRSSRVSNAESGGLDDTALRERMSASGFTEIAAKHYDLIPWNLSPALMVRMDAVSSVLEHAPGSRSFANTMIWSATKPGDRVRPRVNLAEHRALYDAVSVVIPCHNEEANIEGLISELLDRYGFYIREIIVVNDNSTDGTARIVSRIASSEPRVKIINRGKPNGVGLALRDGYRAAEGRYILSMDCDFVDILPEFRGLFDAIAEGADGAIGSRFSHESLVAGYPFSKMVCNRFFHFLIKLLLVRRVRDVSNNLKLYKSKILKGMDIESPHFSANLETGLKPILAGYDIREVPISWINRTPDMGTSSFALSRVGGHYVRALLRILRAQRFQRAKPQAARARAATQG